MPISKKKNLQKFEFNNSEQVCAIYDLTQKAQEYFNLAKHYKNKFDNNLALKYFDKSLKICLENNIASPIASIFSHIGETFLNQGLYDQALECFTNCLLITPISKQRIVYLSYKALSLYYLGEFDSALEIFYEALDLCNNYNYKGFNTLLQINIANIYFEFNDFSHALKLYKKALKSAKSNYKIICFINIANCLMMQKKYGKALTILKYCLDHIDYRNFLTSSIYDTIGQIFFKAGNSNKAIKFFKLAYQFSRINKDKFGEKIYLVNLGKAFYDCCQIDTAQNIFKKACHLYESERNKIKNDISKIAFSFRGSEIYKYLIKISLEKNERINALKYVEQSKSRALLDLLSNSPIDISELANSDNEQIKNLILKEKDLRQKISKLEKIYDNSNSSNSSLRNTSPKLTRLSEEKEILNKKWQQTVKLLYSLHPNYASMVSNQTIDITDLDKIWNKVGTKSAIVEYYLEEDLLTITLIHKDSKIPIIFFEQNTDIIKKLYNDIKNYSAVLNTPQFSIPKSIAKRLYKTLITPICENIPKEIEHLILIPHKELFNLAFASLINETNNQYLCQEYSLSLMPSLSVINIIDYKQNTTINDPSFMLCSISDYSKTREQKFTLEHDSRNSLNDLKHSINEITQICKSSEIINNNHAKYIDDDVIENFSDNFSKYNIIHFAGHAYFNERNPLQSGLILGDGSIITASNIMLDNNFRTTIGNLLVLSACQTGMNKLKAGDEMLGLTRALMYVGMKNLILTLWEVNDEMTAKFMVSFYCNLIENNFNIAKAIQKTQIMFIENKNNSNIWAPFIHFGIN